MLQNLDKDGTPTGTYLVYYVNFFSHDKAGAQHLQFKSTQLLPEKTVEMIVQAQNIGLFVLH